MAELEIVGEIGEACRVAGCTATDVHHWRSADAMFARDFTLAILGHVRALKRLVREVAEDEADCRAAEARALLESEPAYRDSDGRLNVRRWRDALKALVNLLGLDLEIWEPREPTS